MPAFGEDPLLTSELQRQMEAASASGKTRQHTSRSSNPAEPTYLAEYSNGQIGTAEAAQEHTVRLQYLGKALPRSTAFGPTQWEGGEKGSFASMSNLQWGLVPAQLLYLEVRALKGRTVLAEASRPPHTTLTKTHRKVRNLAASSTAQQSHPSQATSIPAEPRGDVYTNTQIIRKPIKKKNKKNSCK